MLGGECAEVDGGRGCAQEGDLVVLVEEQGGLEVEVVGGDGEDSGF